MLFGIWTLVGPRNCVLDGFLDTRRGIFEGVKVPAQDMSNSQYTQSDSTDSNGMVWMLLGMY